MENTGEDLRRQLAEAVGQAQRIENSFGLPPIKNFADVETAIVIASVMARSPGAPAQVLANEAWSVPPAEAKNLIERERKIVELKERIAEKFTSSVLDQNPIDDIAYVERKSSGFFSFLAFLDSRYSAIKKRWLALRLPSYQASLIEQANDMKAVTEYLREKQNLEAQSANGASLFGGLWQDEQSNWAALENYIVWVTEFRRLCVQHSLREQALAMASHAAPDMTAVQMFEKETGEIKTLLDALCEQVGLPADYFSGWNLIDIQTRIIELTDNLALAPRWAAFEEVRQRVAQSVVGELLPLAMGGRLAFMDLSAAFKRAFYQKWLAQVVTERSELRSFHTLTHEQRIKEFQELDERVLKENRASLVAQMRERLQNKLREPETGEAMKFLRRELARQRGLAPLRTTMKQSLAAIRAIKPCFMMSPQTVAQLLDEEKAKFDLVIFDEASQLPTEGA